MVSGAHGSDDGEAVRALQRAAPPAATIEWVAKAAGALSVADVERMPGGSSLATHRVTVTLANGHTARLVLRSYVRPDQVAEDPDVAAHEAAVLELVERIATPTPRLIGVDPTGADAGTPAVQMSELEGRPDWSAGQRWMRQLVEVLDDVHVIDAGTANMVRPFAPYRQKSYELPKWATKPAVWERAIDIFQGPILDEDRTFIHRDFYPGNVLWHRKTVTGLVGWESASVGPRSMSRTAATTCSSTGPTHPRCSHASGNGTPAKPSIDGRHRRDHRPARLPPPQPATPTRTLRHRDDAATLHRRHRRRITRANHARCGSGSPV